MSTYSVNIKLNEATVKALKQGGYTLYGFKAVKTSRNDGKITVWFIEDSLLMTITESWSDSYQAYISTSEIQTTQTTASSSIPIKLGQIAVVEQYGNLSAKNDGIDGAICIYNTETIPYTCGIKQAVSESSVSQCAFPLYGKQMDVIEPVEKIFLVFDTKIFQLGRVVERVYNTGFYIDFTGVQERFVSYDINNGWNANNAAWAEEIPPNTSLSQLLIEQSSSLLLLKDELEAKLMEKSQDLGDK